MERSKKEKETVLGKEKEAVREGATRGRMTSVAEDKPVTALFAADKGAGSRSREALSQNLFKTCCVAFLSCRSRPPENNNDSKNTEEEGEARGERRLRREERRIVGTPASLCQSQLRKEQRGEALFLKRN